jgi:hypothetical protein
MRASNGLNLDPMTLDSIATCQPGARQEVGHDRPQTLPLNSQGRREQQPVANPIDGVTDHNPKGSPLSQVLDMDLGRPMVNLKP